jgi:hypothetical protein
MQGIEPTLVEGTPRPPKLVLDLNFFFFKDVYDIAKAMLIPLYE